nr:MAG TPA: hypothetical protein [Caudoviricetes sp.]
MMSSFSLPKQKLGLRKLARIAGISLLRETQAL